SDYLVDVSLLGLSVPFGVVDARAPEMARTAAQIEEAFHYPVGGIGRYASDLFMGGNPWALSALWLSLYYLQAGKRAEPQRHLEWCLRYATPHGFLAEQQEKRTGEPVSAMPLAWAHAWLIALCHALAK
ncbi:MAG TPA: glycoside hydrolase family 15 protein, partial [Armatimonadota bacterium]|nr:glycoside hydrolase family 15 protein [Armatimonadota bacterium]